MKLIVDGYNLLFRLGLTRGEDLEGAREVLLEMLSDYGIRKKHSILAVFDGQKFSAGGTLAKKSVRAIYTSSPESADDRIAKLAEQMREGVLVVTGDNELISRVSRFNTPFVNVDEFIEKLQQAHCLSFKGTEDGEGEGERAPKKGNPRRLSKKKRKQRRYKDRL